MALLNKFIPKSLWGQLVSLLILALVVTQLIALFVFADLKRLSSNRFTETELINKTVTIVNLLKFSEPNAYKRILRAENKRNVRLRIERRPLLGPDSRADYSSRIKTELVKKLDDVGLKIRVRSQGPKHHFLSKNRPPNILKVSIEFKKNKWLTVQYLHKKPPFDLFAPLLLMMGLMTLFIIGIVSFLVKKITKPMQDLAKAATDLGHGQDVPELPEVGSADMLEVTKSFNQMNKKVKRFVEDRTKMLAAISHDLRTPITSLRLRAEFIEDVEMKTKILETLEEMQVMTEAALKFAKNSNSGEATKHIELGNFLQTLVDDYQDMDKAVAIDDIEDKETVIIPLRVTAMKRALRNVIDNGLNYGGRVKMNFEVHKKTKMVTIYVSDNGQGIDEADFEDVFEPFFRLEKSRNKDTGGVGLGLSISRDIVRAHGGDIMLKNLMQNGKICGLELQIMLPF